MLCVTIQQNLDRMIEQQIDTSSYMIIDLDYAFLFFIKRLRIVSYSSP